MGRRVPPGFGVLSVLKSAIFLIDFEVPWAKHSIGCRSVPPNPSVPQRLANCDEVIVWMHEVFCPFAVVVGVT